MYRMERVLLPHDTKMSKKCDILVLGRVCARDGVYARSSGTVVVNILTQHVIGRKVPWAHPAPFWRPGEQPMLNLRRARQVAQDMAGTTLQPLSQAGGRTPALLGVGPITPPDTPELLYRSSDSGRAVWSTLYDGIEKPSIRFAVITCTPQSNGKMRMALHDAPPPSGPIGRYGELTKNDLVYDHVMLPLFRRVWERYGDDKETAVIIDRRGNIWGASRSGAITQYISRRPPADPGDERFVLPPWIVQLRRVTSVFVDGDGFLNIIGAFLCIICAVCTIGSALAWVLLAVLTLAAALAAYPVTGGFPMAIYYVLSVCISCAELAAFMVWESDLANKYLKPLMAVDVGYHFVRGLTLSAAGLSAIAATPIGAVSGAHDQATAAGRMPALTTFVFPQTADGWAYGIFSGGLSGAFAVIPQILMVAFGYMAYQLWPLLRVELPTAWKVRRVEMNNLKKAAEQRVTSASKAMAVQRIQWVIDQHTNEVHEVQS